MTTISAEVVLRSRHAVRPDKVLSTLLLRYPRWIHAEARTHRLLSIGEQFDVEPATPSLMEDPALSRNAASSRAIPVSKLVQSVLDDPAVPIYWGKNQKGMQAGEECDENVVEPGSSVAITREEAWKNAMWAAVDWARRFDAAGYHKQIVNRLVEPFSHITVVVSGTEWNNFLHLRDHDDAEPHIRDLARAVRRCLEAEPCQTLDPGEWHLPFVSGHEKFASGHRIVRGASEDVALSVARCASTSYKTVDGFDMTPERARMLHDRLVGADPLHASPCEHVAQADSVSTPENWTVWGDPKCHANFVGFRQYRKMLTGEAVLG